MESYQASDNYEDDRSAGDSSNVGDEKPVARKRTRQHLANLNSDNSDDSGDANGWTAGEKEKVTKPKKKKQKVVTDTKSLNAQIQKLKSNVKPTYDWWVEEKHYKDF